MDRRAVLAAGLASAVPRPLRAAGPLLTRVISSTGERVPAVGLGTWLTFDVPLGNTAALAQRRDVLQRFFAAGGRVIDSSPMYGQAEAVLGELLPRDEPRLFSATKVWTALGPYGPTQMRRSLSRWKLPRVDLMQVHNLLAWRAHLGTLREWKAQGLTRLIGITTSHGRDADEVRAILETERGIDVMQITYSPADRSAEPLLELAARKGVAVIINRPFDGGELLQRLSRVPLPPVAADLGCAHWATLVLKWSWLIPR